MFLSLTNPFLHPPPVPPHRGRSVVFHNWRKAVSLPYPRGERPTGLPPHPCGELTEIRHPQGFFMPPPVPHRGSTPAVRSLLDSSPSFCAAKIYVHGQRIKMYILLYITYILYIFNVQYIVFIRTFAVYINHRRYEYHW